MKGGDAFLACRCSWPADMAASMETAGIEIMAVWHRGIFINRDHFQPVMAMPFYVALWGKWIWAAAVAIAVRLMSNRGLSRSE